MALFVIASCQLMVVLDITIVNIALPHIQTALDFSTDEPVLGRQRLHPHLRRSAAARRPHRRHPRPPTRLHLRRAALRPRLAARRTRPERGPTPRRPRPPGRRRRHRLPDLPRADHHDLPRRPRAQPGVRRVRRASRRAAARSACSRAACSSNGSNWRWVLFVNVPIALLIALLASQVISESERHPGHFDFTGALTSTLGMVALVYGFIRAAQEGWRDALTLGLVRRGRRPARPVHPGRAALASSRSPRCTCSPTATGRAPTGSCSCLAAAIFGMFFFLTLFVQNVLGFSPMQAGLAFLPVSAVIAVGAGLTSQLLPKLRAQAVHGGRARSSPRPGSAWLTLTDIHSTYLGSVLGPMLRLRPRHGPAVRLADPDGAVQRPRPRRPARPPGCSTPPSRWAVRSACPSWSRSSARPAATRRRSRSRTSSSQATPAERLQLRADRAAPAALVRRGAHLGRLARPSSMAAIFTVVAALIALFAIQVRPSDLERLKGGVGPGPG